MVAHTKAPGGFEPPSRALQTRAFPLGHGVVDGPGGSCTHDVPPSVRRRYHTDRGCMR
jgi:hypothetical protein